MTTSLLKVVLFFIHSCIPNTVGTYNTCIDWLLSWPNNFSSGRDYRGICKCHQIWISRLNSQQFIRATVQEGTLTKVWFKCVYSTHVKENDSNTSKLHKKDSDFPEKDSSGIKWFVSPQQFTYIKRDNRHNHCQNRASTLYNVLITVLTNRHKAPVD